MGNFITDNIDIWTSAIVSKKSVGRGSSKKQEAYGIKKLRELILELAVRGKLVPQDESDESASVLLKKIVIEREQLIADKQIKKLKKFKDIEDHEYPFSLPTNWKFVRLNDIGDWGAGATPTRGNPKYYGGKIPWFKSGELNADYISEASEYITELALKESSVRYNKVGDVLLAMYGATIGKTSILKIRATTNQAVCACTPFNGFENIFLLMLLKAYKHRFTNMGVGGAQPNISREKIIATIIPLPPLNEQKRIVKKVDELMLLCDKLEVEQDKNSETHQILVETLLDTLTKVKTNDEFSKTWQNIAEYFDVLFTTEKSIKKLEETILQLAVMGKLVAQDEHDEPASELLERIVEEKERLIAEGKIKKQKNLSEIAEIEVPFPLPENWEFVRLGNYCNIFSGNSFKSTDFNKENGTKVIKITNAGVGELIETNDYLPKHFIDNYKSYIVQKDDLILALTRPYISTGLKISKCPDSYHNSLLNQRVATIRLIINTDYIYIFLKSRYVLNLYKDRFGGSGLQPNLKVSDVTELVIPIPPLNEQKRIVKKVDELMALCDSLRLNLREMQTTEVNLADSVAEMLVE